MICGSDHTASAWNAKIGVPRQAPKSLRPSDKLTPNPRSGSGVSNYNKARAARGVFQSRCGQRSAQRNSHPKGDTKLSHDCHPFRVSLFVNVEPGDVVPAGVGKFAVVPHH